MVFPVNESVWEHTKLCFWPALIWALVEYPFIGKRTAGFWAAKAAGLLTMVGLMAVLFYGYLAVLGRSVLWANLLDFADRDRGGAVRQLPRPDRSRPEPRRAASRHARPSRSCWWCFCCSATSRPGFSCSWIPTCTCTVSCLSSSRGLRRVGEARQRMAKRKRAFVLGGGGARGALQVGAVARLLEADHRPDLVVGTSIGALNAAFLACMVSTRRGSPVWSVRLRGRGGADLLPATLRVADRAHILRPRRRASGRADPRFLADHGITPDLRFSDLRGVPGRLVAADLNSVRPALMGAEADDRVHDGVLASAALPPSVRPPGAGWPPAVGRGMVSNVPIEPAMKPARDRDRRAGHLRAERAARR